MHWLSKLLLLLCIFDVCIVAERVCQPSQYLSANESCVDCTVCDGPGKEIVLHPCANHLDTVCGSISDLGIDWSWLPKEKVKVQDTVNENVKSTSFLSNASILTLAVDKYLSKYDGVAVQSKKSNNETDETNLNLNMPKLKKPKLLKASKQGKSLKGDTVELYNVDNTTFSVRDIYNVNNGSGNEKSRKINNKKKLIKADNDTLQLLNKLGDVMPVFNIGNNKSANKSGKMQNRANLKGSIFNNKNYSMLFDNYTEYNKMKIKTNEYNAKSEAKIKQENESNMPNLALLKDSFLEVTFGKQQSLGKNGKHIKKDLSMLNKLRNNISTVSGEKSMNTGILNVTNAINLGNTLKVTKGISKNKKLNASVLDEFRFLKKNSGILNKANRTGNKLQTDFTNGFAKVTTITVANINSTGNSGDKIAVDTTAEYTEFDDNSNLSDEDEDDDDDDEDAEDDNMNGTNEDDTSPLLESSSNGNSKTNVNYSVNTKSSDLNGNLLNKEHDNIDYDDDDDDDDEDDEDDEEEEEEEEEDDDDDNEENDEDSDEFYDFDSENSEDDNIDVNDVGIIGKNIENTKKGSPSASRGNTIGSYSNDLFSELTESTDYEKEGLLGPFDKENQIVNPDVLVEPFKVNNNWHIIIITSVITACWLFFMIIIVCLCLRKKHVNSKSVPFETDGDLSARINLMQSVGYEVDDTSIMKNYVIPLKGEEISTVKGPLHYMPVKQ